jgi:hypothetical protein
VRKPTIKATMTIQVHKKSFRNKCFQETKLNHEMSLNWRQLKCEIKEIIQSNEVEEENEETI